MPYIKKVLEFDACTLLRHLSGLQPSFSFSLLYFSYILMNKLSSLPTYLPPTHKDNEKKAVSMLGDVNTFFKANQSGKVNLL